MPLKPWEEVWSCGEHLLSEESIWARGVKVTLSPA